MNNSMTELRQLCRFRKSEIRFYYKFDQIFTFGNLFRSLGTLWLDERNYILKTFMFKSHMGPMWCISDPP